MEVIQSGSFCGNGNYSKLCESILSGLIGGEAIMTPSCTASLEMTALLLELKEGDEVIMPAYTFVSTANAFALRGVKVVFVDIRWDTLNIDEKLIETAITEKTKAIVVVHYAGVVCEMDYIMKLAKEYGLAVVEDAAQAIGSNYKNKPAGSFGDFSCFSFHETKNITSGGEGGALIVNNPDYLERAKILQEKGTDRTAFLEGKVDKYTWQWLGSSYLLSELQAAYLLPQLEQLEILNKQREAYWGYYLDALKDIELEGFFELPTVPAFCSHNAHIFAIKVEPMIRNRIIEGMRNKRINCTSHYTPLHTSIAGKDFSRFDGVDVYTTKASKSVLRLPIYNQLSQQQLHYVSASLLEMVRAL